MLKVGHYCNALQAASSENHEKVVQMLIDAGVDVNAQSERYGNALPSKNYTIISAEFLVS
jgi:hypothetical protein